MINELIVEGYRGFGVKTGIVFSVPNGQEGSGLNLIVGPNNSGKSTIGECLRLFNFPQHSRPSFPEGKRNDKAKQRICITIRTEDSGDYSIVTARTGGSEIDVTHNGQPFHASMKSPVQIYYLPSRRFHQHLFSKLQSSDRDSYAKYMTYESRSSALVGFEQRLFKMSKNGKQFGDCLRRVMGRSIDWTIDLTDGGKYYLKLYFDGAKHSIEGAGDGIWSVFTICDALYDSNAGETIFIDEPELSLYPRLQRNVAQLFYEYSKDRQLIVSTHSPYFIDWRALENGATLMRTSMSLEHDVRVHTLSKDALDGLLALTCNLRNPHLLGLNAMELFFLEDRIVLVEGQDDVVMLGRICAQIEEVIDGSIFGWGAGGADNFPILLRAFEDLGYERVFGIVDKNREQKLHALRKEFPQYEFQALIADDIRDKDGCDGEHIDGYTSSSGWLKEEYKEASRLLVNNINQYFSN